MDGEEKNITIQSERIYHCKIIKYNILFYLILKSWKLSKSQTLPPNKINLINIINIIKWLTKLLLSNYY